MSFPDTVLNLNINQNEEPKKIVIDIKDYSKKEIDEVAINKILEDM